MTDRKQKVISIIKGVWSFLVGISTIIGCIVSIISCYIAYNAASEIFHLNFEISPIVEKFRQDSVVIIERTAPVVIQKDNSKNQRDADSPEIQEKEKNSPEYGKNPQETEPSIEPDNSQHVSSSEIDNIRSRRDAFLERMKPFFGKHQK